MHTFVGTEEAAISCALVWSAEVDGGCAHGISVGTMNDDVKGCKRMANESCVSCSAQAIPEGRVRGNGALLLIESRERAVLPRALLVPS